MGMNAELLAVGRFKAELAGYMEHDASRYGASCEGREVLTALIECPGSTSSRELAVALGVEPWQFEQHVIDPERVDLAELGRVGERFGAGQLRKAFEVLRDHGFAFYFAPNG